VLFRSLVAKIPPGDVIASGDFFARFNLGGLIKNKQYFEAINLGERILHEIHRFDESKYKAIHLGAPFYWMGMAAYYMRDYHSAIYYIDASISEDIKHPLPNITPSQLFLRLDGDANKQAAKEIVKNAQGNIQRSLDVYNKLVDKENKGHYHLLMDDLRKFLLEPASLSKQVSHRSLATTFITFFIEFDYRYFQLMVRNEPGTNELFFMHLFKGCLLFESILKNNPKKKLSDNVTLEKILFELSSEFNLPEKIKIGGLSLQQVLNQAGKTDDHLSNLILMTGKYRNVLGHNVAWNTSLSCHQYIDAYFLIANSCLHAISVLYRV
jgi:hypothetical protein